ncbi:VOC family protein [Secundilactobacillus muriivasis]
MVEKTRIMLYVSDVDQLAEFWENTLGATQVADMALPDNCHAPILSVDPHTELALFSNDFIAKYSPEVADNQPSLMFFVRDLDAAHERIKGATPIVDDAGTRAFGFPDPDGHYFALGELVD